MAEMICISCGAVIRFDVRHAGKAGRCPACLTVLRLVDQVVDDVELVTTRRKGMSCFSWIGLFGIISIATLIVIGMFISSEPDGFERVGYFKSPGLRAFSYYVAPESRDKIRLFCQEQKRRYDDRILHLFFFSDRQLTPDITNGVRLSKAAQSVWIGKYVYNPNTGHNEFQEIKPGDVVPEL